MSTHRLTHRPKSSSTGIFSAILATLIGRRDNISYHIYLVHAPVIQTFTALRGDATIHVLPAFLICLTATLLLSLLINRLTTPPSV